jgi:class 3 adenylate cyclase
VRLQRQRFSDPIETRTFPNGHVDVVRLDDVIVGRMWFEPGWRWSNDIKPRAGTDRCMNHHLGVTLQGRLRVEMPDGTELEIGPGDVFEIPPGHDAWVVGDAAWVSVDFWAMRSYAKAARERAERVLATILFTDIVDSTATAERLGDVRWREALATHNERISRVLERFGGRLVQTTGDGVLAIFDGAERSVRAGRDLVGEASSLGLSIRVGIHTGEVEPVGGDIRGLAVHLAARVLGLAGPGEILVSATTHDLLFGTDLVFEDRGEHRLRGFAEPRRIYASVGPDADEDAA